MCLHAVCVLCASRVYVLYVPACLMCSRALRAFCFLCTFLFLRVLFVWFMSLTCLHFLTCLMCLHFLCAFIFLHDLHALRVLILLDVFIVYIPYVPSFLKCFEVFMCLTCLHFFCIKCGSTHNQSQQAGESMNEVE